VSISTSFKTIKIS